MSHISLILPYTMQDKSREKPFTPSMEAASIICLVQANRKKPGILGSASETVAFVSKLHYPLWAVPWENECLVVDGLGAQAAKVAYEKPPDVNVFVEELKRGAADREHFRGALEKHAQAFKGFVETAQISFESIVEDEELLSAISRYVEDSFASKADTTGRIALVPPAVDESRALESAEKVADLWRQIQSDIKGLQYALDILNEETKFHEQMISREIEHLQETYDSKIAEVKPIVEEKIEKLSKERDRRIQKLEQAASRTLKPKERIRERLVRQLEKQEQDKSDFQKRRSELKRKGDEFRVSRWEHKIRTCENKAGELKKRITILTKQIEQIQKQSEAAVENFRKGYQVLIDDENRKVTEIEASRDSAVETREKEIEWLKSANSFIESQIEKLSERKRQRADQLKKMTIPWKSQRLSMIGVPFYLVRYEIEGKFRHAVYPPANAMDSGGIKRKIQRAILGFSLDSRIKLLLSSRSKSLERMFDAVLVRGMERDSVLEKNVRELGSHNDIVKSPNFKEELTKGLEELKSEGWINSEEQNALLRTYAQPHAE